MVSTTAIGTIRHELPEIEIIALTSVLEDEKVIGAISYLLKIPKLTNCAARSKRQRRDRYNFRHRQRHG